MITTSRIDDELNRCKKIRKTCSQRSRTTPFQSVYTKPQHGKQRLYTVSDNKEYYIARRNSDILLDILQNQVLREAEPKLACNIELLEQMQKFYTPLDKLFSTEHASPTLQDIGRKIKGTAQEYFWREHALKFLQEELYPSLQNRPTDTEVRAWIEQPYDPCPYHPEQKIHCSPGGVWVRSKSELLIETELEHYIIPHRYECPLQMEDDLVYPDFTILRVSDWKVLYWEHLGMMDNEEYAASNMQKLFKYFQHGYMPFDNLMLTYDRDGTREMRQIDQVIKTMLW